MILSHRHRFIFIKGAKVAGTSAEIALSQVCGPGDIITPVTPADEIHRIGTFGEARNYSHPFLPSWLRRRFEQRFITSIASSTSEERDKIRRPRGPFYNHMSLREVLRLVPAAADYGVFCVERSPYSKVISLAVWARHEEDYKRGASLPDAGKSITDWVDAIFASGRIQRIVNIEKYRYPDGSVRVQPWKTGTLSDDIAHFLEARGLPAVPVIRTKEGAKSDRLAPGDVLRPDQIAAINELFAEEFRYFNWPKIDAL